MRRAVGKSLKVALAHVRSAGALGLLTFVGARVNRKPQTMPLSEAVGRSVCRLEHWTVDAPGEVHAKDSGLGFLRCRSLLLPRWKEFQPSEKEFLDNASEIRLTAGKDLRVTRRA